jgi:hypothetical protein
MSSRALTVVAEIANAAEHEHLVQRLNQIRDDVVGNPVLQPATMPDTHFTRWLILRDRHADPHPDLLIWESNHDGETLDYLNAVVAAVPAGCDLLFGCCTGYPAAGAAAAPEAVVDWLRARTVRAHAFYRAYPRLTAASVKNDTEVRNALGDVIDAERARLITLPPVEIHRRVAATVRAKRPELDTTDDGEAVGAMWAKRILLVIALAVIALVFLVPLGLIYLLTRRAELREAAAVAAARPTAPVHDPVGHHDIEDRVMQNQLTHVVDVKPGTLRIVTLWIVLTVIDWLARVFYVNGSLHGMTTIHFARWVILFDTRSEPAERRHRLVFFSNYDGSWDAYLGEFIDRGSPGLTAIWSNTESFPVTRWLIFDGSRDEEAFKQWARQRQRPAGEAETQAWWSSIPSLTVANVRDNAWVRRRVGRKLDDEEAIAWLRRL